MNFHIYVLAVYVPDLTYTHKILIVIETFICSLTPFYLAHCVQAALQ